MRTIFKYRMTIVHGDAFGPRKLMLPIDAKILHVGMQEGSEPFNGIYCCIWAEVVSDAPQESRTFQIWGTGWPIDPSIKTTYIGTVVFRELVFHIFEITDEKN
jgi:hypothetical protein